MPQNGTPNLKHHDLIITGEMINSCITNIQVIESRENYKNQSFRIIEQSKISKAPQTNLILDGENDGKRYQGFFDHDRKQYYLSARS